MGKSKSMYTDLVTIGDRWASICNANTTEPEQISSLMADLKSCSDISETIAKDTTDLRIQLTELLTAASSVNPEISPGPSWGESNRVRARLNGLASMLGNMDSAAAQFQNTVHAALISLTNAYNDEVRAAQPGKIGDYYRQRIGTDMDKLVECKALFYEETDG